MPDDSKLRSQFHPSESSSTGGSSGLNPSVNSRRNANLYNRSRSGRNNIIYTSSSSNNYNDYDVSSVRDVSDIPYVPTDDDPATYTEDVSNITPNMCMYDQLSPPPPSTPYLIPCQYGRNTNSSTLRGLYTRSDIPSKFPQSPLPNVERSNTHSTNSSRNTNVHDTTTDDAYRTYDDDTQTTSDDVGTVDNDYNTTTMHGPVFYVNNRSETGYTTSDTSSTMSTLPPEYHTTSDTSSTMSTLPPEYHTTSSTYEQKHHSRSTRSNYVISRANIPKILMQYVHQKTVDTNKLAHAAREHMPDWKYVLMDRDDMKKFMVQNYQAYYAEFASSEYKDCMENNLIYFWLKSNGGLYVSSDYEIRSNIGPHLENSSGLCVMKNPDHPEYYTNAVVASSPDHPIWNQMIDHALGGNNRVATSSISAWLGSKVSSDLSTSVRCGSVLLTDIINNYRGSYTVIPYQSIAPKTFCDSGEDLGILHRKSPCAAESGWNSRIWSMYMCHPYFTITLLSILILLLLVVIFKIARWMRTTPSPDKLSHTHTGDDTEYIDKIQDENRHMHRGVFQEYAYNEPRVHIDPYYQDIPYSADIYNVHASSFHDIPRHTMYDGYIPRN